MKIGNENIINILICIFQRNLPSRKDIIHLNDLLLLSFKHFYFNQIHHMFFLTKYNNDNIKPYYSYAHRM